MTTIQQMFFNGGYSLSDDGIIRNSLDFSLGTSSGNTYTFLGASSTTYSIEVLNDPGGVKSIRFPVTYPGSLYAFANQIYTGYFSPLSAPNFNILNDIFYIFKNGFLGLSGIYGQSELYFDVYRFLFNNVQIFIGAGNISNQYSGIAPFGPASLSNSGTIIYTTNNAPTNGGNGLFSSSYGGNSYFYFSI